jgi:hypothetical protein
MTVMVNVDPVNVDADGAPDPSVLLQYGIRGVRLVVRNVPEVRAYVPPVQAAGLAVLGVITNEGLGDVMADIPCDVYQLNNEPDQPNTYLSPSDYVDWWNTYYGTLFAAGKPLEGIPVIGAGLASGQVSYWRDVQYAGGLQGAAAMGLHPYAKTAGQAASLIAQYRAVTPRLPVFVSEWNRPTAEVPAFSQMLRQNPGVMGHAWFCWHNYETFVLGPQRARLMGVFG